MRWESLGWGRNIAVIGICLTAGLATACSTLESIDLSSTSEKDRAGAYLNYSIAKSMFTIQIAAAPVSAQAPVTSSAPVTTTPPIVVPTSTPVIGVSQTGTTGQSPLPIDSSECGVLTARYTAAQTVVAGEISTYGALTIRLAQLEVGKPLQGDTPALLAGALQSYVAAVTDPTYLILLSGTGGSSATAKTLYNQLVSNCPPKVTVTVSQTIVPDTLRTFALKKQTNVFYTDTLTIGTDANGFLTNGAPTSTSQVTAIASAFANDIGLFSPVTIPTPQWPQASARAPFARPIVPSFSELLTALGNSNSSTAPAIAAQVLQYLPTPGSLANLPAAALPLTIYASIEDMESSSAALTPQFTNLHGNYGLDVGLECSLRKLTTTVLGSGIPENNPGKNEYGQFAASGIYDGLVVSGSRACHISATQKRAGVDVPVIVAQNFLWAQDSRYLTILPTTRGFLVPRSIGYTFANGQATGVTDSRPSEALAFVSFPGTVVGSFFAGVANAFTNSEAVTADKTTALTAQTNYLTAQTNNILAQTALQKAKLPTASSPSN